MYRVSGLELPGNQAIFELAGGNWITFWLCESQQEARERAVHRRVYRQVQTPGTWDAWLEPVTVDGDTPEGCLDLLLVPVQPARIPRGMRIERILYRD